MKRLLIAAVVIVLFGGAAVAAGGLEQFLQNVNVQARGDMNGFSAKLSAQFGIPQVQVRAVIDSVREPADAFMCLQLGQWTNKPPEEAVRVYQAHQGKGWGLIAKNLGIKPGSAEFHALKRGDLTFSGRPAGGKGEGPAKGKSKGKGHNK